MIHSCITAVRWLFKWRVIYGIARLTSESCRCLEPDLNVHYSRVTGSRRFQSVTRVLRFVVLKLWERKAAVLSGLVSRLYRNIYNVVCVCGFTPRPAGQRALCQRGPMLLGSSMWCWVGLQHYTDQCCSSVWCRWRRVQRCVSLHWCHTWMAQHSSSLSAQNALSLSTENRKFIQCSLQHHKT